MAKLKLNYLRAYRRQNAFSHEEIARLLGQRSGTAISHYEAGRRLPAIRSALALQALFDAEPRAMFPQAYAAIEWAVARRAAKLSIELEGKLGKKATAKRAALSALAARTEFNDHGL